MHLVSETHFFLGANSPSGFYSLYDKYIDSGSDIMQYVFKGSPGSGKSSFMKKIAKAVIEGGYSAEYIHCSGDPDSLDAVYFPELKTVYIDGTAPHGTVPPVFFIY